MKSDIRVCSAWRGRHDRPVYSLSQTCPECGAPTENSAPAPYNPDDTYGEYRRARKRRAAEESQTAEESQATRDSQATEE